MRDSVVMGSVLGKLHGGGFQKHRQSLPSVAVSLRLDWETETGSSPCPPPSGGSRVCGHESVAFILRARLLLFTAPSSWENKAPPGAGKQRAGRVSTCGRAGRASEQEALPCPAPLAASGLSLRSALSVSPAHTRAQPVTGSGGDEMGCPSVARRAFHGP